jgi:ribose transport system substrate-binding protein
MKLSKRAGIAVLAMIMLTALLLTTFVGCQKKEEAKPYIAVVSKGEQHDFWQQVKLGAQAAAKDYNVDMTFEGPASESDVQDQVEMLNVALAKAPAAIALAALDTNSVIDQLIEARNRKIPVVGFDSGVPDAPEGSIYANASTDNYNAAGVAAEKMFEVIKGDIQAASAADPVKIIVMNQDASGESLLSRGRGFRDNMVELIVSETDMTKGDIKVMGNPAYIASDSPTAGSKVMIEMVVPASASASDTMAASTAVLNRVEEQNILGIFCSNEATVKGLLAATNDGTALPNSYPDLVVIGYDAGAGQKNAVRSGYFLGSITQDPYQIGYKAVELATKAFKGEPVSDVDTGAKFYNADNMDDADIKGLLYD